MRKRILTGYLLAAACVLLMSVAAATDAQVSISPQTAVSQGGTAEIAVNITGNPGVAAWMFDLTWDTMALQAVQTSGEYAEAGAAFGAGTLLAKPTATGMTVTWFAIQDVKTDGELFTISLKAVGGAGSYPISISASEENTINVQEIPVPLFVRGGTVTVSGGGTVTPATPKPQTPAVKPEITEPAEDNPFRDVAADAYYRDAVLWAVKQGVTSGTTANTFSPDATCTRAQAVTFLWRAAGSPEPAGTGEAFSDVASDSYYKKAVAWAVEQGITNGTSATTFSPDDKVTRAQAVTFLWRAAGLPEPAAADMPFGDVAADGYYRNAVLWAVKQGVTSGTTANTFSPDASCIRGQIVTFLYRSMK